MEKIAEKLVEERAHHFVVTEDPKAAVQKTLLLYLQLPAKDAEVKRLLVGPPQTLTRVDRVLAQMQHTINVRNHVRAEILNRLKAQEHLGALTFQVSI